MASTSVSSVQKSFKYDVFLSFRSEDVRKTFVDHLYLALVNKGIITYKDDEKIDKGERINEQLIRSIKDSRFYIIVFSKNYASSSWCLDELVEIMKCQKTAEQTALPVFYDVEPTEVRHQSGAVAEAFAKHVDKVSGKRKRMLEDVDFAKHVGKESANRWRDALREAAGLAGWELKNTVDGHEAKFIQRIVQDILLKLHFINSRVDEKLVGMETRIKNVVSSLNMDCDDVRIIGIKGIGGGGKTTLARAVFEYISIWFEGKCFVEDVSQVSKGSFYGLQKLQKKVLKNVLNDKSIDVESVYEGKSMMKKMLCSRKVLLVLDNVDETMQLEALAGEPSWFKPGSRIIITTRDAQVFTAHQVNFIHQGNFIHDVSLLSHEEAICLFSRYAFGREIPKQGFEDLSQKVVDYAGGLPLTIKILGSHLCGRCELEWEDAIKRLETIPLKEILDILELSYNGLENDQKEIFLDIACILRGLRKKKLIRMLESCGYYAHIGLSVLEQKSLITIDKSDGYNDEKVLMHDHIKELGMNIVRRLHPREPKRHSRLWIIKEIENVLVNESVNEEIKCIQLYYSNIDSAIILKGLGKMKELRLLCMGDVYREYEVDEVSLYLPDSLQSLDWCNYPFYCLPTTFQANKLVNLELVNSNISEFWEGGEIKVLNKLKFLNLRGSNVRTFDLTLTPHLEELNLGGCADFVELQFSVECMNLKFLDLSYSKVSNLNLGMTPHLEHLDLTGCDDLLELQMPVKCSNFRFLLLEDSKVSNLNLLMTRHLKTLTLGAPDHFVEFHLPVECPNLKSLSIHGAKKGNLNLGMTPHLEELYLHECNEFELHMAVECPKLKYLRLEGSKVSKLDLGLTPNLERLYLTRCNYLHKIHAPVGCLKRLVHSDLINCPAFSRFEFNKVHESTDLESVATYIIKARCRCKCLMHPECNSPLYFDFKCEYDEPGSSWSGNLEKLISSDSGVCARKNIEYLSATICGIQHLRELTLEGFHFPVECPNLKSLSIHGAKKGNLNLGMTPHLEELYLHACDEFELHMAVECPKLKILKLEGSKVSNLDLGLTPNLERLYLTSCNYHKIHAPVGCLKRLVYYDLTECSAFHRFEFKKKVHESTDLESVATYIIEARRVCECLMHPECNLPLIFHFKCEYDEPGSSWSGNLEKLISSDAGVCARKNIEYLSATICGIQHLRELTLEGSIPRDLCKLESLEKLSLQDEKIQHLPGNIFMLKHLKSLKVRCCWGLKRLPKKIWRSECLEELYIITCISLRGIPNSICKMKYLKRLHFTDCYRVEKLPEEIGCLECLEELSLGNCSSLRDIPKSIGKMKNLKRLFLFACVIVKELPEELGCLECLEVLNLRNCRSLRDMPNSIGKMKNLKRLFLYDCFQVEKFPEELGHLECLEELYIEDSSRLPQSIYQMKGLRIIN